MNNSIAQLDIEMIIIPYHNLISRPADLFQ